jgi:hypothetical protein
VVVFCIAAPLVRRFLDDSTVHRAFMYIKPRW